MDLATVDKLLTTTRSVRTRLDLRRPVEPKVIQQCLDVATQAPTGGNGCRYHFVVVTDPVKRAGLADLYRRGFAAGDSRAHPTGRLIICCLLYRARLQACNACPRPRTDLLGHMGTYTLIGYQLT